MFGHLISHDCYLKNRERKIEGNKGKGRARRSYLDRIREKANVVSY